MYTETTVPAAKPRRDAAVTDYASLIPLGGLRMSPQLGAGLYTGVPAAAYHADPAFAPSLSSTLARVLLEHSPAHAYAQHPRLNAQYRPRESSAAMSFGSLVHALLADPEGHGTVEIGHFPDFRTKEARAWRDEVAQSGRIAVLEADFLAAEPVAEAVRRHAGAGHTNDPFNPRPGHAAAYSELTLIWEQRSVYYRALIDRLVIDPQGYCDLWDWKTTSDVSDRAIERAVYNMGYAFQLAFYLRGLGALLPSFAHRFTASLVFVETAAPYTVRRVFLTPEYLQYAQMEAERACALWEQCIRSNRWDDPRNGQNFSVELPAWAVDDEQIVIE